jgi:UV DNA damage endonuclease
VERAEQASILQSLVDFADSRRIRFMRLSSEMFPFASHAKYGYNLEFADKELNEAGELARKYGHRLTLHPGQVRCSASGRMFGRV